VGRAGSAVRTDPAALSLAVATLLGIAYLLTVPHVPDLAAQVARADAARRTGGSVWWGGWYGGIATPPYSLLTGPVMGFLGVAFTGAAAMVGSAWLAGLLLRHAARPRAGALATTGALAADLLAGRVTFAIGVAVALGALVLLQRRRPGWAVAVAVLTGLLSPLAAFFLGLIAGGVVLADVRRRTAGLGVAAAAVLPVLAIDQLFPQDARMPVSERSLWVPLITLTIIASLRLPKVVRATAALSAVSIGVAFLLPSPVGSNAQRLALVAAAPVVVALVRMPRRWLIALVAGLLPWPLVDVATSFAQATDPSAQAAYYTDLVAMLPHSPVDGRLEVVEPRSHWSSAYLASKVPLARGWERQVDTVVNPAFYAAGALTADGYHQWLQDNAVRWVALPDAALDFGSVSEAKLVEAGLPYLRLAWWTDHWRWYVVESPAPVSDPPATETALGDDTVTVDVARPGSMHVRVHWSPQLGLDGPAGCIAAEPAAAHDGSPWIRLTAVLPGRYVVRSGFSPLGSGRTQVCTPGWGKQLPTPSATP
jgi:hypothetical protein